MKILPETVAVIEVESEGLISLLNKNVTFFCAVYIYTGKLVGVSTSYVKLENPKIVYETGAFTTSEWKDAQALPNEIYLQLAMIESFGIVK